MPHRKIISGVVAMAVMVMGIVALMRGTKAAERGDEPKMSSAVDAAAELPDDLDLVIVIDHATELRDTPIGQSVRMLLGDAGAMDELSKSWKGLADQLGWSEEVAFDRLLGRRIVLVSRSYQQGQERRWAILSDVSAETEQRLKEKLQAAPRAIDAGHQILSVENGQYELASHRRAAAVGGMARGAKGAASEGVTIVLAPAGRAELFDEIIGMMAVGATRPLSRLDVIVRAASAGPAEVLLLANTGIKSSPEDPDAPPPEQRWRDFIVLAGRRAEIAPAGDEPLAAPGATWQSRVIVRDGLRRSGLENVPETSDAAFRALDRDALLAVVQAAPLSDVLGSISPIATILGGIPLPENAKALVRGRQAVRLRAVEPRQRVVCTVAMETSDAPRLAKTMDGAISRAVQAVEQRFGAVVPPPRDYAGVAPQASRVVGLTVPENSPLKGMMAEPLAVAWSYPVCGVSRDDVPHPGWWALSLAQAREEDAPSPAETLRDDAAALTAESPRAEVARWVCLAAARPARLEGMLPAIFPDIRNFRSIMRRFDRLNVRLSITEAGDIQGDLTVTLAPK